MAGGNQLHYGDNLPVLQRFVPDASVDLVYLDPPFNSNRAYNVLFSKGGYPDAAQGHAFDDTWHWTPETEDEYQAYIDGGLPLTVADALGAFRALLSDSDMLAYLVNMAPRLVELRRVLKPTGSLYLHCDPTASHYLKLLMDSIFGPVMFRSEIIWKRSSAHNSARRYGPVHDVILFYTRSDAYTWNKAFQAIPQETMDQWYNNTEPGTGRRYNRADLTAAGVRTGPSGESWRGVSPASKGRHWAIPGFVGEMVAGLATQDALDALDAAGRLHWPKRLGGIPMLKRYLDESTGIPAQDVITDVKPLNNVAAERLGYPTQKPLALLDRFIRASSNPGDVVLDPFCGCGTTIDAAARAGRQWVGIDISFIAVDLIRNRLEDVFGPSIAHAYHVTGIPSDVGAAQALFEQSPFEFERWAVSLVGGTPNEKQVGDKGVDGVIRFHHTRGKGPADGKILVSVKGGRQLNPSMVQALDGALTTHKAQMGVLVTLNSPTRGMREIAARGGSYEWPFNQEKFSRLQLISIEELLSGKRLHTPPRLLPYISAVRQPSQADQIALGL